MTEAEYAAEIAGLTRTIQALQEAARPMSNLLAPVKRRKEGISEEIALTYRHRRRQFDGAIEIVGFAGEHRTVRSRRLIAVRQEGEQRVFEYGEVEARVVISDPAAASTRAALYDELTRIAEHYGHDFERERHLYADIAAAQRGIERLLLARERDREQATKRATRKPKKGGSGDDQSSLF
jgi:hypothetical protein